MSLAIQIDDVTEVLLVDGWHEVADTSFDIDSYEFLHDDRPVHSGGNYGICAAGFFFKEGGSGVFTAGTFVTGPLSAVLAVRIRTSNLSSALS